ncbi:MAG TPA: hypothetical protein VE127_13265 [Solirubrobacteraceae bacterium]|nr:hypothetical protein [Solirubrobacteraceae bacterium]
MGTALTSKRLVAALTRLTGKPIRKSRHGQMFRVKVVSKDGKDCAVAIGPISEHRKEPSKATLNMVADRLRVDRQEIVPTLSDWSPDDLRKHLEGKSAKELRPPARGH